MRRDHREGRTPHAARRRLGPRILPHLTRGGRFLVYAAAGVTGELAWTALRGRPRTSVWMLPVYGFAQLAFEPVHDALRERPRVARAVAYGCGFTAWEYASGRALRTLRGSATWDYAHARGNVDGLVRASYVPLWALAGLAFERLHDSLV